MLLQHGTWQIFRGDSTSSSALVAEIKPSLMSIGGKKIKVSLAGRDEPEFVIQVRAVVGVALRPTEHQQSDKHRIHRRAVLGLICTAELLSIFSAL